MKRKNVRSLGEIAVSIHRLERANIKDIGDALIEAKSQCEHGEWLQWLMMPALPGRWLRLSATCGLRSFVPNSSA